MRAVCLDQRYGCRERQLETAERCCDRYVILKVETPRCTRTLSDEARHTTLRGSDYSLNIPCYALKWD